MEGILLPSKTKGVRVLKFKLALILIVTLLASCGGGGTNTVPNPISETIDPNDTTNSIPLIVDGGTNTNHIFNRARVSIKVCAPNDSTKCQIVDNVILDTGSSGLRLLSSALNPDIITSLPVLKSNTGNIFECMQFVSGYMWGQVSTADVMFGSKIAPSLSIQLIDNDLTIPNACNHIGSFPPLLDGGGASNGILGISTSNIDGGTYYTCPTAGCNSSTVEGATIFQPVVNPITKFDGDNNGIIIDLPAIQIGGVQTVSGTLTFGIGTRNNNKLSGQTIFPLDINGYTSTVTVDGIPTGPAYFDTGTQYMWFTDLSLPTCSGGQLICPIAPITRALVLQNSTYSFNVSNINEALRDPTLFAFNDVEINRSYGSGPGPYTNIGLSFFYGKRIFFGQATSSSGQFVAF